MNMIFNILLPEVPMPICRDFCEVINNEANYYLKFLTCHRVEDISVLPKAGMKRKRESKTKQDYFKTNEAVFLVVTFAFWSLINQLQFQPKNGEQGCQNTTLITLTLHGLRVKGPFSEMI